MSPAAPSPPGEPEPQAAATGPAEPSRFQDLAAFRLPPGFHGRPAWFVQLWWAVQASLFARSPRIAYGWRRFLLRLFGARIGRAVLIRPSARCIYPWRLAIGDRSWIGEQVELYTLAPITIGKDVVVSQRTFLCAGGHDPTRPSFDTTTAPITVEDEAWIAADVFVAPGVTVGRGAVIAARSTLLHDARPGWLYAGYPARPIRPRIATEMDR